MIIITGLVRRLHPSNYLKKIVLRDLRTALDEAHGDERLARILFYKLALVRYKPRRAIAATSYAFRLLRSPSTPLSEGWEAQNQPQHPQPPPRAGEHPRFSLAHQGVEP